VGLELLGCEGFVEFAEEEDEENRAAEEFAEDERGAGGGAQRGELKGDHGGGEE
jgi:hypothetical protein